MTANESQFNTVKWIFDFVFLSYTRNWDSSEQATFSQASRDWFWWARVICSYSVLFLVLQLQPICFTVVVRDALLHASLTPDTLLRISLLSPRLFPVHSALPDFQIKAKSPKINLNFWCSDAQFELKEVVLMTSACLNASRWCYLVGWLDVFITEQQNVYLTKQLNRH